MSLKGMLATQIEVKSNGDLFHELYKSTPHEVPNISSGNIQDCDLDKGSWGTVGSVLNWKYIIDEEEKVSKEMLDAIDEEKKMIRFRAVEGDHLKLYKEITFTGQIDTTGVNHVVTRTTDYEKLNENVPEPHAELQFIHHVTKEIDSHLLKT